MIKTANKLKIYLYASLGLAAAAMIVATLSYFVSFDEIGYFNYGTTPFPIILNVLCILSVAGAASVFFIIPKGALDGASPTTLVTSICATPIAAISALFGGFLIVAYLQISASPRSFMEFFPDFSNKNSPVMILMLGGVFLIISAIYFALTWFPSLSKSGIHSLLGFAPPLAGAALIGLIYFDFHVAMNSPLKVHFQFTVLFFVLFMLYEVRTSLGKPRPRCYLALVTVALVSSAVSSVPQIVAYLCGIVNSKIHFIYALLSLGVLVYTAGRLIVFVSARCLLERISDQTYTEEDLFPADEDAAENEEDNI